MARLSLRQITKRYPSVVANDDVSLDVLPGEIHAVLGENGAGKSTLMKIIAGEIAADAGSIEIDGQPVAIDSPARARGLGIAMVHQHFALFDSLTVAENIALGLPPSRPLPAVERELAAVGGRYGLAVDPAARVHDLSVGERQRVEILRALLARPRLLILDEPTSVLTPQSVARLFETLRRLAADGLSVLFISHKLDEIRALASRCTVLRAGRAVAVVDPRSVDEAALARLMIGADPPQLAGHEAPSGGPLLVVRGLRLAEGAPALDFDLRSGEILGVAGISGNGQRELMAQLAGERLCPPQQIRLDGVAIGQLGPAERRRLGLRYVPEERVGHGTVPMMSLADNALLTADQLRRRGLIDRDGAYALALRLIAQGGIKATGAQARADSLSGGNLQKFVVGREIEAAPRVLIADQPTWGVDAGAAAVIRNQLIALRLRGAAVLIVSEEIDELFALCDRLMVMARRRLSPVVAANAIAVEELGRWMAGLWPEPVAGEAA